MSFASTSLRITGATRQTRSPAASGNEAIRNFCASCGSLVFGGLLGTARHHTIYAGTLDDPSLFRPTVAIFTRGRPSWAVVPPGLELFEGLPGR